jgi:hypothetical protein
VSHFSDAVTGYAPLILDLTTIKRCSFQTFMKACNAVFAAVDRDASIPKKLQDSSEQVSKFYNFFTSSPTESPSKLEPLCLAKLFRLVYDFL